MTGNSAENLDIAQDPHSEAIYLVKNSRTQITIGELDAMIRSIKTLIPGSWKSLPVDFYLLQAGSDESHFIAPITNISFKKTYGKNGESKMIKGEEPVYTLRLGGTF